MGEAAARVESCSAALERHLTRMHPQVITAANFAACVIIFYFDAIAPTGVSFNGLYFLVIIASTFSSPRAPLAWGSIATLLSAVAIFTAPVQLELQWELTDRAITIVGLWAATALVIRLRSLRDTAVLQARKAQESADSKARFLSAASHDLRQPVQSLLLFAAVLESRLKDHPARSAAESIATTAGALKVLLEGIFDLSRLDAGVTKAEVSEFGLGEVLARVAAEYVQRTAGKGIFLHAVPTRLATRSDRVLLERIIRNLVENAVNYTERGGVLIGARRRNGMVRIDVVDTGPGIPEALNEKIFDEFYQIGNPERSREHGYGLGLAIVRRTAGLLGHRVEVRSRLGRGTRFSVYVPLCEPPKEVVAVPVRPVTVPRGVSVLVVEDDALVSEALSESLEQAGCRVVTVPNGPEAVAAAKGLEPSFMVSDFRLPGNMDGVQTIERVREETGRNVPACVLTGDLDPAIDREAARLNAAILRKPVGPEDLLEVLGRSLRDSAKSGKGTARSSSR